MCRELPAYRVGGLAHNTRWYAQQTRGACKVGDWPIARADSLTLWPIIMRRIYPSSSSRRPDKFRKVAATARQSRWADSLTPRSPPAGLFSCAWKSETRVVLQQYHAPAAILQVVGPTYESWNLSGTWCYTARTAMVLFLAVRCFSCQVCVVERDCGMWLGLFCTEMVPGFSSVENGTSKGENPARSFVARNVSSLDR